MKTPLSNNPKLFSSEEEMLIAREQLAKSQKKLVVTNGCFDLLHCGHIYYLQQAATLGDELWIGLNGESSVRALKGETRPVQGDLERAYMLGALNFVSRIFIFNTPRLDRELRLLKPDIYVKAGDYTIENLDSSERDALQSSGSQIIFLPFLTGFSTTKLIEKINRASRAGTL